MQQTWAKASVVEIDMQEAEVRGQATDMAVSNSERSAANAFFGTPPEAFATNLRCICNARPHKIDIKVTFPLTQTH